MTQQWMRACSLVIADDSRNIELAGENNPNPLRIRFVTQYFTAQTPASLRARVYNLSPQTRDYIIGLCQKFLPTNEGIAFARASTVTLKAGYVGNIATVFFGYVYQLKWGKENNVDSYLEIYAGSGDMAYAWGTLNEVIDAGSTPLDKWQKAADSVKKFGTDVGPPPEGLSDLQEKAPRGSVMWGMTRDVLRDLANTYSFMYGWNDQTLEAYPKYSARGGQAVLVNRFTGMIGIPEQTEQGIELTILLNPIVRWGTLIQINDTSAANGANSGLNQLALGGSSGVLRGAVGPNASQTGQLIPPINPDGNYVTLHARHEGDTRGNPWYTHITCLSIDPSAIVPKATLPPPLATSTGQGQGI